MAPRWPALTTTPIICCMSSKKEIIESFCQRLESLDSDGFMKLVEKHIDNDSIEVMADHVEKFYGVEEDETVGMLAQIMLSGYLMGKETD